MTDIATTTARDRAERIRAKAADLLQEITEAFENRDHITLGYRTWGEYCRAEFDGRIALPRVKGDRVELCAALVDAGLSQRAVAEATGLSRNTVSKYVAPPAQNEPPRKFTIPTTIEGVRELADTVADGKGPDGMTVEQGRFALAATVTAWTQGGRDEWVAEFERTNPKRAAKIKAEVKKKRDELSDEEFALFGDLMELELKHRAETERFLADRRGKA